MILNRPADSGRQEALDFVNKPADLVFAGEVVNAGAYAGGSLHCSHENLPGFKVFHEVFRRLQALGFPAAVRPICTTAGRLLLFFSETA